MKTAFRSVTVVGAAILLCSCHFHLFQPAAPPRSWVLIEKRNSEPIGYNSYTYVIFGQPTPQGDMKTQQIARNRALLAAIAQTAPEASAAQANLFCVPAKPSSADRKPALDNYNPDVADMYRGSFDFLLRGGHQARILGMRLETDAGPFLITMLEPMGPGQKTAPLLITDLSTTDPGKVPAIVAAYRQAPEPTDKSTGEHDFPSHLSEDLNKAGGNAVYWMPAPNPG
jgi:hypothetical protein